jgi:hypothetical protein
MDFAKSVVEKLITDYAVIVKKEVRNGNDIYVLYNGVTIRLPSNYSRIEYIKVQLIATEKLGLHEYEFDYWIGQQITN